MYIEIYFFHLALAQLIKLSLQFRRSQFDSWVGRIPWRRDKLPTPVFLGFPIDSDGILVWRIPGTEGYSPWGFKELDTIEQAQHIKVQDNVTEGKVLFSSS